MGEGSGQGDGRAEDGADRRRARAVEERPGAPVAADLPEAGPAEQDEEERRGEGDHGGEDAAGDPGGGVADDGDGLNDRARRDLAEGDGVEELRSGHPVVVADRVGLHERDDDETAAEGQPADLERDPRHRGQHPAADREHDRGGQDAAEPGGVRAGAPPGGRPGRHLDDAAAEQDQDQPGADDRGGGDPGGQVDQPADGGVAVSPAGAEQRPGGVDRDRGHRGARARSRAEHPERRGPCHEQHRQGEDDDQAGDDERSAADQGAGAAAQPPGAVDGQLGGGRAGHQVADRDGVLELPGVQPAPPLDAQLAQQPDVRGRAAEPDAADPTPFPQHGR